MDKLVLFLIARLAEDEARGHSLVSQWYDVGNACQSCGTDGARVLADVKAKREIVKNAQRHLPGERGYGASHFAVMQLASVYSDHPDFDPSWR